MVVKIIIGVWAYLTIGALFCGCLLWIDRHNDDPIFFEMGPDEMEISFTVVLWPLIFSLIAVWFVVLKLPYLFFKGFITLLTALFYTVKAYMDNKRGQHCGAKMDQEEEDGENNN